MTFLTGKALPRRTVLRGLGATLSLPLLDAMLPALSPRATAAATPAHRFLAFYVPNGMAMEYWTPKGEGRDFELSPILEPLAPFRNQMLVLSGINASWNYIHAGASGSFLTGTTRGGRNEVEILADVSMDQLLARHFAKRDAGRLARARDGCARQRRRLHGHPELRLHAHDLLAQCRRSRCRWSTTRARCSSACSATAAAPDGRRVKRGCSSRRACSTRSTGSWRSAEAGARRAGSGQGRAVHGGGSRHRAPHSEGRAAARHRAARRSSSHRACRRCSRITSR